jgi:hypothetical protein
VICAESLFFEPNPETITEKGKKGKKKKNLKTRFDDGQWHHCECRQRSGRTSRDRSAEWRKNLSIVRKKKKHQLSHIFPRCTFCQKRELVKKEEIRSSSRNHSAQRRLIEKTTKQIEIKKLPTSTN